MLEHHAYLFRSKDIKSTKTAIINQFSEIEEIEQVDVDNFGINESRSLVESAFKKPRIGNQKLIIISLKNITVEAAQALLKILEEPPQTVVFAFCIPDTLYLLPTLLSRFNQDATFQFLSSENSVVTFTEFKAMKIGERMALISDKLTAKDVDWVNNIKTGLINLLSDSKLPKHNNNIDILLYIAKNLQSRGASNKQLLEELALTL